LDRLIVCRKYLINVMAVTLGGWVCVRNGDRLGYCWREAIQSLLPICQEVIAADCDSDDGTWEAILEAARWDRRIKPFRWPWTNPQGVGMEWWVDFLNAARSQLKTEWGIYVDGDELVDPGSYDEIKRAVHSNRILLCRRLNFWADPKHLIPYPECLGHNVIRIGPASWWFPTDAPHPKAEQIAKAAQQSTVKILHYGMIRKPEFFIAKHISVGSIWGGGTDPRLVRAMEWSKETGKHWGLMPGICGKDGEPGWESRLVECNIEHPDIIKPWLVAQGYGV
jgi:glycosyltransferase involved in cell wall biosynthesis